MIFVKNNLIFAIIWDIIKLIFKGIYRILRLFNLQLTFFYGVLGLFAEIIFGIILKNDTSFMIYHIGIILTAVYAIVATIMKALGLTEKKKNSRQDVQIVKQQEEEQPPVYRQEVQYEDSGYRPAPTTTSSAPIISQQVVKNERPNYFRVSQNPKYIMAEYSDRYELFYEMPDGLKHIRTDFK